MYKFIKKYLVTLVLLTPFCGFSQTKFSLEKYTPQLTQQDGVNCFAYASAYVALSTLYAFQHKITADSAHAYSLGFVDGAIKYLGQKKVRQAAVDIWGGDPGDYGNLDDAFYVLIKYGTVNFYKFPYVSEKAIKRHFNAEMMSSSTDVKILSRTELVTPADYGHFETIYNRFKNALISGHTVICAIHEDQTECDSTFIYHKNGAVAPMSNHIVNVIGYDDTTDSLQVKNNFDTGCAFYISRKRFCDGLSWAYTFVIADH